MLVLESYIKAKTDPPTKTVSGKREWPGPFRNWAQQGKGRMGVFLSCGFLVLIM